MSNIIGLPQRRIGVIPLAGLLLFLPGTLHLVNMVHLPALHLRPPVLQPVEYVLPVPLFLFPPVHLAVHNCRLRPLLLLPMQVEEIVPALVLLPAAQLVEVELGALPLFFLVVHQAPTQPLPILPSLR